MSITTNTVGRLLGRLVDQKMAETIPHGVPAYACIQYDERIYDIETNVDDPENLILIADGRRFTIKIFVG